MNSAKLTIKKTNKPTGTKNTAELSAPATTKNAQPNSTNDARNGLALNPIAQGSRPAPTPAKVSAALAKVKAESTPAPTVAKAATSAAKVNDARTTTRPTIAALAVTPRATSSRGLLVEDTKASRPMPVLSAPKPTTIEAKIDVGFGNTVYLRGQGPGLSWDRGVPCECVDRNTWRWTAPRAEKLTFKLLLNDSVWARGADLVIGPGEKVEVVPAF